MLREHVGLARRFAFSQEGGSRLRAHAQGGLAALRWPGFPTGTAVEVAGPFFRFCPFWVDRWWRQVPRFPVAGSSPAVDPGGMGFSIGDF